MSSVVPIPARNPLFGTPAGRPGDWWEPLPAVPASVAARLRSESRHRRLPVDLLAALLVEHAVLISDIAACAVGQDHARATLAGASCLPVASGPGRLNTPYLQMLGNGDAAFEEESEAQLARRDLLLPLRLHEAGAGLVLEVVCRPDLLNDAVALEIASATSGGFMREWALRTLLAAASA